MLTVSVSINHVQAFEKSIGFATVYRKFFLLRLPPTSDLILLSFENVLHLLTRNKPRPFVFFCTPWAFLSFKRDAFLQSVCLAPAARTGHRVRKKRSAVYARHSTSPLANTASARRKSALEKVSTSREKTTLKANPKTAVGTRPSAWGNERPDEG